MSDLTEKLIAASVDGVAGYWGVDLEESDRPAQAAGLAAALRVLDDEGYALVRRHHLLGVLIKTDDPLFPVELADEIEVTT